MRIGDWSSDVCSSDLFNVLATDVYKQVIGQQNFQMGAVVSVVLLFPAVIDFFVDRMVQRKQVALLSALAVPLEPKPAPALHLAMFTFSAEVADINLCILGMAPLAQEMEYVPTH